MRDDGIGNDENPMSGRPSVVGFTLDGMTGSESDIEALVDRIASVLNTHTAGRVDKDCGEACCWQHFCTCGAVVHESQQHHQAFVIVEQVMGLKYDGYAVW